ncbi:MAG: ABC transporter permease [Nitrospinales bacterium]
MTLTDGIGIATTSLKARKSRTLLASLGIVIGIAAVIIMVAIGKGSQEEVLNVIRNMGENLITLNAGEVKRRGGQFRLTGNVTTLKIKDAEFLLEEIDGLARAVPYEARQIQVKFGNTSANANVAGTTADFLAVRKYEVAAGRFFDENDSRLGRRVAVLGQTTINNIFPDDDPIGQVVRIKTIPFTVIGTLKPKGMDSQGADQDDILLIPMTTMMRRVLNQTYISTIYLQAVDRASMDSAAEKIREALRKRHRLTGDKEDDFTLQNQLELEDLKLETKKTFTALIVGVAAISLIVGGIGILAVMLVSVKERTREIGVRRAVGATKLDIIGQFVLESLAIGMIGGAGGVGLGVGVTLGLAKWSPWTLLLDRQSILIAAGVCVMIGVLFGIYPAIKASRLDPMDALKVE